MDLKQKPSLAFANRWSGSSLTCIKWSKTGASFAASQQSADYHGVQLIAAAPAQVGLWRDIRRQAPANRLLRCENRQRLIFAQRQRG
jgi:hypothetical protein